MWSTPVVANAVKKRPELWLPSNALFKNKRVAKKKWNEIALELNVEVVPLKKKWKNLKDQYRKQLKKCPLTKSGEPYPDYEPSWKYYDCMDFMKDHITLAPDYFERYADEDKEHKNTIGNPLVSETDFISCGQSTSEGESMNEDLLEQRNIPQTEDEQRNIRQTDDEQRNIPETEDELRNDTDFMYFMSIMPNIKKLNDIQKLRFKTKVNNVLIEFLMENNSCQCDNKQSGDCNVKESKFYT